MGNKANFTRRAIVAAARQKLLIDVHDGLCRMTAVEHTLPNFVTREYCHARQGSRRAFIPTAFLKSETARVLVISSGLICLPDAPEEYAKKADLFAFIRRMPATCDDTRIFNSRIDTSITTARRSGREWFVGSVINEAGGELAIPLDFFAPDIRYDVTCYEDAPDSHDVTNREACRIRQGMVKRGDTIQARLAPGGGHCLWIGPHSQTTTTLNGHGDYGHANAQGIIHENTTIEPAAKLGGLSLAYEAGCPRGAGSGLCCGHLRLFQRGRPS